MLAALIGFSRLYLQVHYLSDVLGGMVIGIIFGIIAIVITNLIYKKFIHKENKSNGTNAR